MVDQLNSLFDQTVQGFKIHIYDDGSKDRTRDIVEHYQKRYPNRIEAEYSMSNSGSAAHSFFKLMTAIRNDYLFLCDQDDIWLPDKIEKTLAKITAMEQLHGRQTPILVHTDLSVVDENLNMVSDSFKNAMNGGWEKRKEFRQMLIMNIITGCTAVYNGALAALIFAEPSCCVMHDWWLLLVASAFGVVSHVDDQTVLYRQHTANVVGAKDVRSIKYKLRRIRDSKSVREAINETYSQANSFLLMYSDKLTDEQTELLKRYAQLPNHNKIGRIIETVKLRTWKHGLSRKIAQVVFV